MQTVAQVMFAKIDSEFKLPVQTHKVRQNTFQQLFLYKRQFFQLLPLAAQMKHSEFRGKEQHYTSNR